MSPGAGREASDPRTVPRFPDEVSLIPVAHEAVLYHHADGSLHRLDRIGALVARLFDGETAIATVVEELAEAFETERSVIEGDVLRLVEELGRLGLLVEGEAAGRCAD